MQFGVSECVGHWGRYAPKQTAVIHNGREYSYREYNQRIDSVAAGLIRIGCTGGARVAVAVSSKLDYLIATIGVLRAGAAPVILNTALSENSLKTNITDTNVKTIVHDAAFNEVADSISVSGQTLVSFEDLSKTVGPADAQPRGSKDEWGVLFSSGTTGTPKGIERDHDSMVIELLGWCLELGLGRSTVFFVGRPVYYTGGLVLSLATLLVGGRIVLRDYVDNNDHAEVWRDYTESCTREKVSWAFFVPDQLRTFCTLVKEEPQAYSETILVMGAPISGEEKRKARELLGSGIVESWGNSESLGTITDTEDLDIRPESVGRPFLSDELYIIDDDHKIATAHETGLIAGSENAGFFRYSNRPEATSLAKRDNLIISEDIGHTDDDGYFYVEGRVQDFLLVDGRNVILSEVAAKVQQHQQVEQCCIVAVQVQDRSKIHAVIKTVCPWTPDDLLAEINNLVDIHEQIDGVSVVDELPMTASGKIHRTEIESIAARKYPIG